MNDQFEPGWGGKMTSRISRLSPIGFVLLALAVPAMAGEYISFEAPGSDTQPIAIGESGHVTGRTVVDGRYLAFAGDPEGELRLIDVAGSDGILPTDIARDGTAIGFYVHMHDGKLRISSYISHPDGALELLRL
jgi:hypothetical protein